MKILITGTTQGIGKAIAELFLNKGHDVFGIDRQEQSISHSKYTHFVCDVRDYDNLPKLNDVDILINNAKVDADFFHIDGGSFPDGYIPFNSHVSKNWFCIGSEWESARGLGIWYFIISIGGVLNQDKSEMNIHETVHLNSDAFDYWVNDRRMQPNNNIKWPTNLPELKEITIRATPSNPKPDKPKILIKGINK